MDKMIVQHFCSQIGLVKIMFDNYMRMFDKFEASNGQEEEILKKEISI